MSCFRKKEGNVNVHWGKRRVFGQYGLLETERERIEGREKRCIEKEKKIRDA
jgi:hypothetical protein